MNRRLLLIILIIFGVLWSGALTESRAQYRVGGILDGRVRWTAGNVYLVESDILIPRFSTLTIDPGARIQIAPGKGTPTRIPQIDGTDSNTISIKVEGTLVCSGTPEKRIRFAPLEFTDNCGWYGIIFRKVAAGTGTMSWTGIAGAYNGITVIDCRPTIRNTSIERNNIGINCLRGGTAQLEHSIIAGNFTAGIRIQKANPVVENCIIVHNRGYGFWGDGVSAAGVAYNCFFDNTDGNFQDCDPALGKPVVSKKKQKSTPADAFGNLFCDPVFAGSEADSIAVFRARSNQPPPRKLLHVKLPGFLQPAPPGAGPAGFRTTPAATYTLSRFSPCVGAGRQADGSACDIGMDAK